MNNISNQAFMTVLLRDYQKVLGEKNQYKRAIKLQEFENMVKSLPKTKTSRIVSLIKNISAQRREERNKAARTIQSAVRRTVLPRAAKSPLERNSEGYLIPRSRKIVVAGESFNAKELMKNAERHPFIWDDLNIATQRKLKQQSGFVGGLLRTKNANVNAVIREMQNIGVNINKRDYKSGYAPLHYAVVNGSAALVKRLLDMGANPNVQTVQFRERPLHLAAREGKIKIAEILLEYGANPNARDAIGRTPLSLARNMNVQTSLRAMFSSPSARP